MYVTKSDEIVLFVQNFVFVNLVAEGVIQPQSYVLYSRIRSQFSNHYDQVRVLTGSALHELGHARGIANDGSLITPPHSGSNVYTCIMISPATQETFTDPKFCDGHNDFIGSVNW